MCINWRRTVYRCSAVVNDVYLGRFGTYKRLLEAQYGDKLVLVPHYEFEILGNASDLPTQIQLEYVKEKLGLEWNCKSIYFKSLLLSIIPICKYQGY